MLDRLRGVLAPVVSTFDPATGALAAEPFRRNVRAHLDAGLAGVLVAGSSGEAALLEADERARLVAVAREAAGAEGVVLAGVGAESTRATVRLARDAADAGAAAVLVVAPHYYGRRMSAGALEAHYTAVADASAVPVLLYNVPLYMHYALPPDVVHALAAHPNVVGMKDSAGDLAALARYLEAAGPAFRVLTGHAATFGDALAMGAQGGILAAALFAPAPALAVYAARVRGASDAAAEAALATLGRDVVAPLGPPGLKAALDMVGLDGGAPRPPLLALEGDEREQVRRALAAAGVAAAEVAAAR